MSRLKRLCGSALRAGSKAVRVASGFPRAWLAAPILLASLVGIAPAHAGDVTPTANSLSGQVWSNFTPNGTLPTTTNVTIATGQFNYSTNSTTIPVAVGPTFTVMRTAGPTGLNQITAAGTFPPGSTPATGTGFPATVPELHEVQGTGVVMRYTFSSALPTGSHVWAQDVDSSASMRYEFYDCSNTLLNPSGYDYLLFSAANQPTRSFTSTQVTLTAPAVSANEPLGAIIIRSSAVCRIDVTTVAAGTSTSQETYFSVPQPRITLTKALGSLGRISNTDEFTVRIQSGATTLNTTTNSTTTGTGTTVTGGTGTTGSTSVTVSGTYTLSEVAAGTTTLGNYAGTISCTNSNSGSATILPTGTGTSFSITPVDVADVISCTLTNARAVDLAVTKTNGVSGVNASGTTSYTVTVTNNGPNSTTGAILSDPAVTGLSKTSVTCGGTPGQCVTPPTVTQLQSGTFALPALASGQTYQITVNANVTATSGSVSNVATVSAAAGTLDLTSGNNSATDIDPVVTASLSAPTCPAGLAPNNVISNGSFAAGTGPNWTGWTAAAIWTGSGLATVTNDTVSGSVSQAGLTGLLYGPSTSERAVVQLSARWVNQGTAGNSLSTSLGLFVAGVEYARITTPTGLGTTASVTYFNGASGNLTILNDNVLTGWRIDLPAAVASSGSVAFAFTAGAGGIADDFTIDDVAVYTCTPASLTIVKSSTVFDDGVNPAFLTPANDVTYTIEVANTAAGVTSNSSIFLYDTLPTQMTFFNGDANGPAPGSDAVIFTDGGSGLSWTLGSDVAYSNSASAPASFAACTYTPSAGYDPNVRHVCANPKGVMAAKTGSPTPAFTLTLRAQIK